MTKTQILYNSADDNSIDGARLTDDSISNSKLETGIDGAKLTAGSIPVDRLKSDELLPSTQIEYANVGSLAEPRTVESRLRDSVNVFDYIPPSLHEGIRNRTETSDLSQYVQAAINAAVSAATPAASGAKVYFPSGTYKFNVSMRNHILEGDGSTSSIISPYDVTVAAVTVVWSFEYWQYHKEIRDLGFYGSNKTGVGVAFGITDITEIDFAAGNTSISPGGAKGTYNKTFIQYAQNAKFYGCYFTNLDKGISWTTGNIGSEIYSCGFAFNRYGAYMLNNKGGGDVMQSGCKHFYGGEMSRNICAIYSHNETIFQGQINLTDTVLEYNDIALYLYDTCSVWFTPFTATNVWFELNGKNRNPNPVDIDSWSGSATTLVKGLQTVQTAQIIIDGSSGQYKFNTCGILGDVVVKANSASVIVDSCRVEGLLGCSGGDFVVENPNDASIKFTNCYSDCGGIGAHDGTYVKSFIPTPRAIDNYSLFATVAAVQAPHRSFISSHPSNQVISIPFTSAETLSGNVSPLSITGSLVNDGVLYQQCNEFTKTAFARFQYYRLTGSDFTTSAGWYVCTFDAKVIQGKVWFDVWDRGSSAMMFTAIRSYQLDSWKTYASIRYSPGGQSMRFEMEGEAQPGIDTTWRLSALQILRFDSRAQAENYVESLAYSN